LELAYHRWLTTLKFDASAAQTAFTECWQSVKSALEGSDGAFSVAALMTSSIGATPTRHALEAANGSAERHSVVAEVRNDFANSVGCL
jgi:hypothetical protein